jgi:hypothetical protein
LFKKLNLAFRRGSLGVLATLRAIFFSSRKDAEAQRNCGPLGLTSGGLCGLAALQPVRSGGRLIYFLFYSRNDAEKQRNCGPLGLTSGGLCGLAALRALFFFFFSQRRKEIVVVK